jgi:hypothetical protein
MRFVLKQLFIGVIILALSIIPNFFDVNAFAQYSDISQLSAKKFTLEINNTSYDLYYGYRGSLDSVSKPDESVPVLSLMDINQERKSLEITMSKVPEKNEFWVRIPFEVIYAENENYKVLVDGVDTKYDLMKFPNDYVVGMFIPQNAKNIEIIGTRVLPEFGLVTVLILGISILGIVFTMRKTILF